MDLENQAAIKSIADDVGTENLMVVLGMPGENKETVKETAKFLADCTYDLPEPPYGRISINRLEALPGTPVYEFGKINGFIGKTPQLEEEYLIKISDTSGAEFWNQLNFTDYPDFIVEKWRRDLWFEIMNSWFRNHLEEQSSLFTIFKKGLKTVFLSTISLLPSARTPTPSMAMT